MSLNKFNEPKKFSLTCHQSDSDKLRDNQFQNYLKSDAQLPGNQTDKSNYYKQIQTNSKYFR